MSLNHYLNTKKKENMSNEKPEVTKDQIFFFEEQEISIPDFASTGFILDIGGGGEGIIGQLKKNHVIAIDPNQSELEEATDGPLKIVMDASQTLFLDSSFEVVTSFFTLMYIQAAEQEKVFQEMLRVLVPGGRFLIWDADLPKHVETEKEVFAFYLTVNLPDREVKTGYGTKWPQQRQDLTYYKSLAERVGFHVSKQEQNKKVFFLELVKPFPR